LLTGRPPAELTLRRKIAQCRGAENPRGRALDFATAPARYCYTERQTQQENAVIGVHYN
jgi:hypothetical protein